MSRHLQGERFSIEVEDLCAANPLPASWSAAKCREAASHDLRAVSTGSHGRSNAKCSECTCKDYGCRLNALEQQRGLAWLLCGTAVNAALHESCSCKHAHAD